MPKPEEGADRLDNRETGDRALRILHISDLHERAEFAGMPPERKSKLEWDARHRGIVLGDRFHEVLSSVGHEGIDLVCFTGDLADWGHRAEYEKATERVDRILKAVGVPRNRFLAVPGNHDVQRNVQEGAWRGIRKWLSKTAGYSELGRWFLGVVDPPPGVEAKWREELLERTVAFWKWFESFTGENIKPQGSAFLGYRRTFAPGTFTGVSTPIHAVGLDSAWLCGAEESAGGTVLKDQGSILVTDEQTLSHIRDGEHALDGFRFALVHHPLDHLADHHSVRRLLGDNGVDILFHGHQHSPLSMDSNEPGAHLRVLGSGCLMEGDMGKDWPNEFHVLEVDPSSCSGTVRFRKWSKDARFWAVGSDIYREAPNGTLVLDANHIETRSVKDARPENPDQLDGWERPCRSYIERLCAERAACFSRRLFREANGEERDLAWLPEIETQLSGSTTIQGLVAQQSPLLLQGEYGSAKTFLLRWLCLNLADKAHAQVNVPLPVYLDLSAFRRFDVEQAIASAIWGCQEGCHPEPSILLRNRRLLVLVDGIEELDFSAQTSVAGALNAMAQDYPGTKVVVAARTAWPHQTKLFGSHFQRCSIQGLSDQQCKTYFSKYCSNSKLRWEQIPHRVRELSRLPVHLEMVIEECSTSQKRISDTPSGLFAGFVQRRLRDLDTRFPGQKPFPKFASEAAARSLAVACVRQGRRQIAHSDALLALQESTATRTFDAREVLENLDYSGLIAFDGHSGLVGFSHMAIRDYLACLQILEEQRAGRPVSALLRENTEWFDAIVYAVGLMDSFEDQSKLLDDLLGANPYLFFRALENRKVDVTAAGETPPQNLDRFKCAMAHLATTYSRLVSRIAPRLKSSFPPFFGAEPNDAVASVRAVASHDGRRVHYRYFVDDEKPTESAAYVSASADVRMAIQARGVDSAVAQWRSGAERYVDLDAYRIGILHTYELASGDVGDDLCGILSKERGLLLTPDLAYEKLLHFYGEGSGLRLPSELIHPKLADCSSAIREFEAKQHLEGSIVEFQTYPKTSNVELRYLLHVASGRYSCFGSPLLPGPDVPMYERLMTIPACYSADRVLEVVSQAVRLVLSNYAELVETHFPQIGPYLPLYSVLPVKVSAVIVPGGEHGPTWSHYLEPVEKGGANVVDIRLGRESDEAVLGAEWRRKVDHAAKALSASGRDPRIGASVLTTMSHSILEFWHDSILEDSVFSLLIRDFKKLFGKFAASGHEPTWHLL